MLDRFLASRLVAMLLSLGEVSGKRLGNAQGEAAMGMVARHKCRATDDDGRPVAPLMATCGICDRSWCDRCDPTPSALCHYCHGMGTTTAPIPPRQARELAR